MLLLVDLLIAVMAGFATDKVLITLIVGVLVFLIHLAARLDELRGY